MLNLVGVPKGELFIDSALTNELEHTSHLLQDLFCVRVKVAINESETFILGDWNTTFRQFLGKSFKVCRVIDLYN